MNPLSSLSYLLPPLIVSVVTLVLTMLVWREARRSLSSRIFCGLLLSVTFWSLLIFCMRSSPDVHRAVLWDRVLPVGGYATFVVFYHFTVTYTNIRGQKGLLVASYLLLLVFAALIPTDLIVERMRLEYYGYAPVVGPISVPLSACVILLVGAAAYNLFRQYTTSYSGEERNRILYLLIAIPFPLLGGLLDAFSNLPPASIWGHLIFCIICSIAIVKYHLLDIRIIARKSLAYVLTSIGIAVPYVSLLYLLHYVFKATLEPWWAHAVIILLLAIILRPLYSWSQQLVDRLFYRDRYDYLKALGIFSLQSKILTESATLGSTMVNLIARALRPSGVYLLQPLRSSGDFGIVSSAGMSGPAPTIVLSGSSPLVEWLKHSDAMLSYYDLDVIPQLQSITSKKREELKRMGTELIIQLKPRAGQLSGILILGRKISEQPYTVEDKELIYTLSTQMAIKLENTRLYDLEKTMRKELQKQDEEKTEFLHSVAHELKTPLTAIISSSEILGEESLTAASPRKRLINNIRRSAWSMDRRVTELLDLAQIQVGGLRIKPSPLEIGPTISQIASQVLILFENKKQTLTLEMPDSLPKVNADREKLEQVLFNLLSNANKFSPSGGNIILRVREADRKIIVEVEDSAPAVTEEEKMKLFDPYYRGEHAARREQFPGLGLGLAISKKLVELHQGEIWVENKLGKGNTFAFSLPALDRRTNGIV